MQSYVMNRSNLSQIGGTVLREKCWSDSFVFQVILDFSGTVVAYSMY